MRSAEEVGRLLPAMPYFSRRVLVSLSPFVNLDLFKKGYYHVACKLVDDQGQQNFSRVTCVGVRDLFGPKFSSFTYPGACVDGERFFTQTVLVEYTDQTFQMGEWAVFLSEAPVVHDYTEAYVATNFTLLLELEHCPGEEVPEDLSKFSHMAYRSLAMRVDWRKGLHDHFPVIFDYFHMAAVGVTVHASLVEILPDEFAVDLPDAPLKKWPFQSSLPTRPVPSLPDLATVLFGQNTRKLFSSDIPTPTSPPPLSTPTSSCSLPIPSSLPCVLSLNKTADGALSSEQSATTTLVNFEGDPPAVTSKRAAQYLAPQPLLQRAQEAHQMLCDIMASSRDSLVIGYNIMTGEGGENIARLGPSDPHPIPCNLQTASELDEAEEMCRSDLGDQSRSLAATWEWFCECAVVHPDMMSFLAVRAHNLKLSYMKQTVVAPETAFYRMVSNITDPLSHAPVVHKIRQTIQNHLPFYSLENVESPSSCSVIFVEPCPWATRQECSEDRCHFAGDVGPFTFTRHVQPYLMNALPKMRKRRRRGVHLVVCIHGLQGNQFDLRLYRIYLSLALPQVKLDFLMAQSNQRDTFCDFNTMTNRLLSEVLEYVTDMPTPPTKISFIGHSLGNIVVRSLVTRPEFAPLIPKLHLFVSICAPHLGTRLQNSIISMGMWAVRKWYNSVSLLQLSLKDSTSPRDSFLYQLSEAPSMECFRHVVLLSSPQDKYVPYHSAKLSSITKDGSLQSNLSLEMMQNILEPLRQNRVDLVRISIDHCIPTSANSVIGRAAHIAMLDSELFIEKIVTLHLVQYFVD